MDLFRALCKLALGGSDDGLLTWARTLNREFDVPLDDAEVRGVAAVCVPLPGTLARPRASTGVAVPAGSTRAQGRHRVRCGASVWLAHRAATVGRAGHQSGDLVSAFPWGENGGRKRGGERWHTNQYR